MAVVIDPGTGAYYGNLRLRNWLASRKAHNGPCPVGLDFPKRLGPFLWSEHHAVPTWEKASPNGLIGELALPHGRVKRRVEHVADGLGWHVEDSFESRGGMSDEFTVRWQFAPGSLVKNLGERKFSINRADVSIVIEVDEKWNEVQLVESPVTREDLEGIVSPAFRQTAFAPYLKMTARSHKPCVFRTTFLACATS